MKVTGVVCKVVVLWGLCFCPSIQAEPTLDLPSNVATISSQYLPAPAILPEYILIQDVHHHAEVQGKIAALILYAYEHWGARRVYTEGAFSKVDLTVFHRLPETTRHELLERLIHEGNLSGPELAAVLVGEREWRNPPVWPLQLVGMEDVGLYTENLRVFRDLQRQREGAIREVESLRRLNATLNLPEPNIFGSELDRAKSLLELRLTPADYSLYLAGRSTLPDSPQLQPMLHEAEKFYELVNERSVAFLKESSRKLPAGNGPRILIVGGFHTAFMTEQLRQQGFSYIVLSPSITQAGNRKAYEKQLLNSMDTLDYSRLP